MEKILCSFEILKTFLFANVLKAHLWTYSVVMKLVNIFLIHQLAKSF